METKSAAVLSIAAIAAAGVIVATIQTMRVITLKAKLQDTKNAKGVYRRMYQAACHEMTVPQLYKTIEAFNEEFKFINITKNV